MHYEIFVDAVGELIACRSRAMIYFGQRAISARLIGRCTGLIFSAPSEKRFHPLQQTLRFTGFLPLARGVLIHLGQGWVDMNGAEYLVQTNAVFHGQYIFGNQITGLFAPKVEAKETRIKPSNKPNSAPATSVINAAPGIDRAVTAT